MRLFKVSKEQYAHHKNASHGPDKSIVDFFFSSMGCPTTLDCQNKMARVGIAIKVESSASAWNPPLLVSAGSFIFEYLCNQVHMMFELH